ncbi:hypothetical protein D3C73_819350 [compost metagenome]
MHEHAARAARAAAVAGIDAQVVDVHTVGIGHADAVAGRAQQMGGQAHGGRLAVGAGDRHHRNAAVVAVGVHVGDDGFAHGAALAERGVQVHAQPRRRVHFHHAAMLVFQGEEHALGHDVHAADVQADHAGRGHGACRHLGVNFIGHVGGRPAGAEVGVVAQEDQRAGRGHGIRVETLFLQRGQRDVVKADLGQRRGVPVAAQGVGIDLIDQFADGVLPVAGDLGRVAARRRHHVAAHHQQAEIVAGNIAFDDDFRTDFLGDLEGLDHPFARFDIDGHAAALAAVAGLDHHRAAERLRGFPGFFGRRHGTAHRHWHACGVQQHFGQVLVLRDRFRDGAGQVGFSGLDAALLAAPAELHHAALRQPAIGNVARDGGVHDGPGAGAQAHVFIQIAQALERVGQIERCVVQRGANELLGQFHRQQADGFFAVFHHHLEHARFDGGRRAAKGHRATGVRLHRQRGNLQDMRDGHGALMAFRAHQPHLRQPRAQAGFELGQVVDGALGVGTRNNGLDRRVLAPQIGAAQGTDTGNFHGRCSCQYC